MKKICLSFILLSIGRIVFANEEPLLPEKQVAISAAKNTTAFYAEPTRDYAHGILGDAIEAKALVVTVQDQTYQHRLSSQYVFEDIRPRLFDVDLDGALEFITIRTHVDKGAGIAIYKVVDNELSLYAQVDPIGKSHRWLNIAAVADLDRNGRIELVWVQTPHIGGIVKVASIQPGVLKVIDQASFYSNHAIGSRNLCLSVLSAATPNPIVYLPQQHRRGVDGFVFSNQRLKKVKHIDMQVDFQEPLKSQYPFDHVVDNGNCIFE